VSLKVPPEEIDRRVAAIKAVGKQFMSMLTKERNEVNALCTTAFTGVAATAFDNMFADARTQFEKVDVQIEGIATTLNNMKDGFQETDIALANQVGGASDKW
jgi:WXG100 family type VII secretion target